MAIGNNTRDTTTAFRDALKSYSGIKAFTSAGWLVGEERIGSRGTWDDEQDSTKKLSFSFIDANVNFIPAMGIRLKSGRNFSSAFKADTAQVVWKKNSTNDEFVNALVNQSIILNETAVKTLGLQNPVGKRLNYPALQGTVIGVVSDFNASSLHKAVTPIAIRAMKDDITSLTIYLRLKPGQTEQTLKFVKKTWKRLFPDKEFSYSFVDENLQKLYLADSKIGLLFSIFSTLAIGIACLGLFGLVLFMTEKRTKEIGIRKVLGASVIHIVHILTTDFLKPIFIGLIIAFPLGLWAMNVWLQDFAYRIFIGWQLFTVTGITVITLALSTIIFITIKSASANPVKSLRTE